MGTEYGWVIEHGGSQTSAPLYWCGGNEWYEDHMRAIRFARMIDAAKVRDYIDFGVDHCHRVAEHGWNCGEVDCYEAALDRQKRKDCGEGDCENGALITRYEEALRKIAALRYVEDANEPFDEALDTADEALRSG